MARTNNPPSLVQILFKPRYFSLMHQSLLGGSRSLVGGDSCPEGHGFESQHRIPDGHFSHIFCCKNCNVCLKR